jgi:potassium large conductance calcium-activated channel subfamily M alpha protein 1
VYLTRVFRFLYAYKLDKVLQRHSMEVARLAYQPLCTVLAVIIINASILIVVEQDSQFHEYVYFMVVTMATVGFGDVVP